jgi:hypothetical protein
VQKRSELERQLENITDRREELAEQLTESDAAARPGLMSRIAVLDERSAHIEMEILHTDDAIAAGFASGLGGEGLLGTGTEQRPDEGMEGFTEERASALAGGLLALVLLGIVVYQWAWRRARSRFSGGAPNDARLDQLQNAVDAIAVEVERISEGQRYVAKMLNEGTQPGAGVIGGEQEEAIPVRRKAT